MAHLAAHALVYHFHAQLFEFLRHQPAQTPRHIADFDVGTFIKRIGKHAHLIARQRKVFTRFGQRHQCGGAVTQGDDVAVVLQRPFEHALHLGAVRQGIECAVAAGNKHADIGRIGCKHLCQYIGQFQGLLQFGQISLENGGHGFIVFGHGPHFKLGRIARHSGHIDFKAGFVQMQHGQQGFYRMVAGGKTGAVLHGQIALVGSNHQHFVFAAGVGLRKLHAVKIGFRRHISIQGKLRREKRVVFRTVGHGFFA